MMSPASNLLQALQHLILHNNFQLLDKAQGHNRANSMGSALEEFVKDSFANSFTQTGQARLEKLNQIFSYLGNANNPPDMIIYEGDALEVKKIQSITSNIALNSSYPKDVLHRDDPRLTNTCRELGDWQGETRDILYIIGFAEDKYLKHLFCVYGDCYAASRDIYQRIQHHIVTGFQSLSGDIELAATKELGRVNRVDPLGITLLRVRGMWHIDNPLKVFSYLHQRNATASFAFTCLLRTGKYSSFPAQDREALLALGVDANDVKIQNPNNPSQLLDAIMLTYEVAA